MGTIRTFNFTERDLEDAADAIKKAVLRALADEKILDYDIADDWSRTHTVIIRYKTFFRTLSNLWNKLVDDGGFFYLVVKVVE